MLILRWRNYTAALNCRDAADALCLFGPRYRWIGGGMTMRYAGNMKFYGTAALRAAGRRTSPLIND
jgi:hypothetical protein